MKRLLLSRCLSNNVRHRTFKCFMVSLNDGTHSNGKVKSMVAIRAQTIREEFLKEINNELDPVKGVGTRRVSELEEHIFHKGITAGVKKYKVGIYKEAVRNRFSWQNN